MGLPQNKLQRAHVCHNEGTCHPVQLCGSLVYFSYFLDKNIALQQRGDRMDQTLATQKILVMIFFYWFWTF